MALAALVYIAQYAAELGGIFPLESWAGRKRRRRRREDDEDEGIYGQVGKLQHGQLLRLWIQ